jgi:hypothetical protein
MVMHVERKHWWTQLPISWGVEMVLVIALVAGTVFAATHVRGRDLVIADQAAQLQAVTQQQQATADVLRWSVAYHERVAALDSALIDAYGQLQAARRHKEQVLAGEYGPVDETVWIAPTLDEALAFATAWERQAQARIGRLLAERQSVLTFATGIDPR